MIYLSDDYFTKYIDTFSYIMGRAIKEGYSFPYIEKTISSAPFINELERSNITLIAFSSSEKLYNELFPHYSNNGYQYNPYDIYAWMGYIYIHLFFKYQITFELLFIILPIETLIDMYKLYHEMDFTKMFEVFHDLVPYTYLDNIMKKRDLSSNELAIRTNISIATIKAIRYGSRDIEKLEFSKLFKIAKCLNIKTESLLTNLELDIMK